MVTSNNNSTRANNNHEEKQSRSSLIVKIPPYARMKKSKLRAGVKLSKNSSFQKPLYFDSDESKNEDVISNDDTSIDENTLEENEIDEIISLLEHARSRSYGIEDNVETYAETSLNNNVMKTQKKKIPKKYY